MAVNIHCHNPPTLLAEIRGAIDGGRLPGWRIENDALIPELPGLAGRVQARCSSSVSSLLLGIEVIDETDRASLVPTMEGCLVRMLGMHFRFRYQLLTVSANVDDRFHEGLE